MSALSPERWRAVSPYFDRALELPADERPAWLAQLQGENPALAADLATLLEEHATLSRRGFLEDGPRLPERASLAGQIVGAYTLVSPLGHGGMGSVWLARRSDGRFEGLVAVKFLNAGLVGRASEERFRREGGILARLTHPHVAHLIDAGVSSAGQPYLVIEHVEGTAIDRHCDENTLSIEARVRLFLDVLAAVAHAHANLIVHRDIKPSNVLVTKDGQVKLLDFGIAKLLGEDSGSGEATMLTREGGWALTPEYAAPEQVRGEPVTTATDVYSLGVLLYVLLTGRHPSGDTKQSPAELLRAVVETDAPRMSTIRRSLRGDLETIVAKALKKHPGERYASVGALADDLRRYLDHEPISARPDTLAYRAAKFVRRNRVAAGLASLVLIAVVAGLAGTVWQARRAAHERDGALAQLARSEAINEFNQYLIGHAPHSRPLTRVELLESAEQLVAKQFSADEALGVELLASIGVIYMSIDEIDRSRRVLKSAFDAAQRIEDPSARAYAYCGWGRIVAYGGDYPTGRKLVDAALARLTDDARYASPAASCLMDKAVLVGIEGDADAQALAIEQALARMDILPNGFDAARAVALSILAQARETQGRTSEAERAYAEAARQLERLGRADTQPGATLLNAWARVRSSTGDMLGALELQNRSIAVMEAAAFHGNRGRILNRLGRDREAIESYKRALALAQELNIARTAASAKLGLARVCRALGDLPCARTRMTEAAPALEKSWPAGHVFFADLAHEQALLALAEGDTETAATRFEEALARHAKVPAKQMSYIETLVAVSRLEVTSGRLDEAERHARDALKLANELRGDRPTSSWVGLSELALGNVARARGNTVEARTRFQAAASNLEPTYGASHRATEEARAALAALR
jgi:serine/threonine-protein kinase